MVFLTRPIPAGKNKWFLVFQTEFQFDHVLSEPGMADHHCKSANFHLELRLIILFSDWSQYFILKLIRAFVCRYLNLAGLFAISSTRHSTNVFKSILHHLYSLQTCINQCVTSLKIYGQEIKMDTWTSWLLLGLTQCIIFWDCLLSQAYQGKTFLCQILTINSLIVYWPKGKIFQI